mmetsp:Transcript_67480/g.170230  ORF Transcript_67480/g.170230 Transcript_67480/m.170230 type:complete len:200 (+) Transcript_67480:316-915(+)
MPCAGITGALPQEAADGGREPRADDGLDERPTATAIWSANSSPACLRLFMSAPLNCSSNTSTWLRYCSETNRCSCNSRWRSLTLSWARLSSRAFSPTCRWASSNKSPWLSSQTSREIPRCGNEACHGCENMPSVWVLLSTGLPLGTPSRATAEFSSSFTRRRSSSNSSACCSHRAVSSPTARRNRPASSVHALPMCSKG